MMDFVELFVLSILVCLGGGVVFCMGHGICWSILCCRKGVFGIV